MLRYRATSASDKNDVSGSSAYERNKALSSPVFIVAPSQVVVVVAAAAFVALASWPTHAAALQPFDLEPQQSLSPS